MRRDDDSFEDRKKSQEAKYKMDEERRFKARSRRDKLAGLWAAGRLGLDESQAKGLAAEAVVIGLDTPADADFARALAARIEAAGGTADLDEITEELSRLDEEAARQVALEFPMPLDADHRPVGDGPMAPSK